MRTSMLKHNSKRAAKALNIFIISQVNHNVKKNLISVRKFSLSAKKERNSSYRMSIVKRDIICYNKGAKEVQADEKVSLGLTLG